MSELHNLSAPTEESSEEISKKVEQKQQIDKAQAVKELKTFLYNFKQKYLGKLFLSLGIAVTVCIFLIWIGGKLFSPDTETPPTNVTEVTQEVSETPDNTVKYTKFDGHQYFFYIPEDYGFLNRTRNDDLNEVVFSHSDKSVAFVLQEFEADNDSEETLDSIYAYIATTVPPDENIEVKIGDNTFKRRLYKNCSQNSENTEIQHSGQVCVNQIYYSTYINGLVIIFNTSSAWGEPMENTVLNTFAKNVIDSQVLTDEYIQAKLPSSKNKLQAHFIFGTPIKTELKNNFTEISWQSVPGYKLILEFDPSKLLTRATGLYDNSLSFNLLDKINDKAANAIYKNLNNGEIKQKVLDPNPNAKIYIDDHISGDNYWEVTISSPDSEISLGAYKFDKTTNQLLIER
jgi:hypothetical protein